MTTTRRTFLEEVGGGMLAVLVGPTVAAQLGFAADNRDDSKAVPAELDKLASLLQQTPTDKLVGVLAEQIGKGTSLRDLIAGGALANARAFGGQDYNGYHTFMALCPAYSMAMALPEKERALPIFKVLVRNSTHIHGARCEKNNKLEAHEPAALKNDTPASEQLRAATRKYDVDSAERIFAAMKDRKADDVYDDVQLMIQDDLNVHRVVLAWRAWEVLGFTGKDHARDMLRQTVRFCSDTRHSNRNPHPIRDVLPKLLDEHKLLTRKPGTKKVDDAWVQKLAQTIYADKQQRAAADVAAALADGVGVDAIGEALALASTMLVLNDPGRPAQWTSPNKPEGSVHGDSVGVHASDAANAWRHIAAATSARNAFASLIAAAYHTAGQSGRKLDKPYPTAEDIDKVEVKDADKLLGALNEAIKGKDQRRACAVTAVYGKQGHEAKALLAALRALSLGQDGALHAEKYFHTASEEYARSRPAFRWQHVVALARVTASQQGWTAPGVEEARKALKLG